MAKHIFMTAASPVVAAGGIYAWMSQATSIFGLVSAFCGALMGVCGVVWWFRRLRAQKDSTPRPNQTHP